MKLLLVIFLMLLSNFYLFAQSAINKTYGTLTANWGIAVIPEQNGYFIVGDGYSNQVGNYFSIKLLRIDSIGNLLWEKDYGKKNYKYQAGATGGCCKKIGNEGYIVPGYTLNATTNIYCGLIVKFDTSGDALWVDTFRFGNNTSFSDGVITADEGFAAIGVTTGLGDTTSLGDTINNVYLVKVDSTGKFLWQKTYGGGQNNVGNAIGLMPDGGFILSGFTDSFGPGTTNNYLIRTDADGNIIWSRTYGTSGGNQACLAQPAVEGGFIMFGIWDTTAAAGTGNYVAKLDTSGNITWITFFDSSYLGIDQIKELDNHEIIVASDKNKPPAVGYFDEASVIKLDTSGNELLEKLFLYNGPGISDTTLQYVSGNFYDFQPTQDGGFAFTGISTYWSDTANHYINYIWLLKTDSVTTGIEEIVAQSDSLKIYPNPAYSKVTIEWQPKAANEATVMIYDMLGRIVSSQQISSGKMQVNVSGLEDGLYVVRVLGNDGEVLGNSKLAVLRGR